MLIPGFCVFETWTEHPDTNKQGAQYNPARTVDACKAECVHEIECTAIDYSSDQFFPECWLHGPWSANNPLKPAAVPGILTHYVLTRQDIACK